MRHDRRGFTLFELMMVVSILAIVASIVVPLVGNDESSRLRAAAELLAADIEDVQAKALVEPEAPGCLVIDGDGSGWRLVHAEAPDQPLLGPDGRPVRRAFGSDALAGCPGLSISAEGLPGSGLRFDDQGAPTALSETLSFELRGGENRMYVRVSASTGRVSIQRP